VVFRISSTVHEIISAQLKLYQRFSRYIDLPTKIVKCGNLYDKKANH